MDVNDSIIKQARKIFNKRGWLTQKEQLFLHKVIVELKDNQGISLKKIGQLLNKSKGTIYNYYHFEYQSITREVESLKEKLKEKDMFINKLTEEKDNQINKLTEKLNWSQNTINHFCTDANFKYLNNLTIEYEQLINEVNLHRNKLQNQMNELEQEKAYLRSYLPQNIDKILRSPNGYQIAMSIINQNKDLFFNRLYTTLEGQIIINDWLTNNIKNPAELIHSINTINNNLILQSILNNKN